MDPLVRSFLENLNIDFFQALAYCSSFRARFIKHKCFSVEKEAHESVD